MRLDGDEYTGNCTQDAVDWLEEKGRYIHADRIEDLDEEALKIILLQLGDTVQDGFDGLKHMMLTQEKIRVTPGINLLKDAFKGQPVILAMTGPSLTKQIPLLKETKALIMAPDVSLHILEQHGIIPHFVCAVERYEVTTEELAGSHKSHCVVMPVVAPSMYEKYKGPLLIAYRTLDHFKLLPWERGVLYSKGIVGNMCMDLAIYLGCSPIILIGSDLSFSGTITHAEGMKSGEEQPTGKRKPVPGYYGGEVETDEVFGAALMEMERLCKGQDVFNCTEGGAAIKNTIAAPFADIASKIGPQNNHWWIIEKRLGKFRPGDDVFPRMMANIDPILGAMIEEAERDGGTINGVAKIDPFIWQTMVVHVIQPFAVLAKIAGIHDHWSTMHLIGACIRRIQRVARLVSTTNEHRVSHNAKLGSG